MYVILDRALPHHRRRPEARAAANHLRDERARPVGRRRSRRSPRAPSATSSASSIRTATPRATRPWSTWRSASATAIRSSTGRATGARRTIRSRSRPCATPRRGSRAYAQLLLDGARAGHGRLAAELRRHAVASPTLLPARLPNLLLNGTSGIAVGMATDVPPHNLREVAAALIRLLDDPDATLARAHEAHQGPGLPDGRRDRLEPRRDLAQIYKTGTGTLRLRARYEIEDGEIVITELPFQASGAKVLEQIAAQMRAKKLPMVEDLRDESDHENPTRLVIAAKSKVDLDALMNHLFATTELERTFRVNINVIGLDGRPRRLRAEGAARGVAGVPHDDGEAPPAAPPRARRAAAAHPRRPARRLSQHRRGHQDHPPRGRAEAGADEALQDLTDVQAEAILELKLRHLAKLEEMKIRGEQKELADGAGGSRADAEVEGAAHEAHQDRARGARRGATATSAAPRSSSARPRRRSTSRSSSTSEPVTVVLSERGWARAAKGHDIDVDGPVVQVRRRSSSRPRAASSNQLAVFIDSTGRAYSVGAHTLPSARGQGEPLSGLLQSARRRELPRRADRRARGSLGRRVVGGLRLRREARGAATRTRRPARRRCACPRARPSCPRRRSARAGTRLAAVSSDGRLLVFPLEELPELAKGKGNKILAVPSKDGVMLAGVCVLADGARRCASTRARGTW